MTVKDVQARQVNKVLGGLSLSLWYPLGPLIRSRAIRAALLGVTYRSNIRNQRLRYHVMVTVRCDLFLEALSHVDDASLVKITVGAGAHVHTNC